MSGCRRKSLTAVIQLRYDLTEENGLTWVDIGELEDAILNMTINAKHAMPEGGSLTITTQNVQLAEKEAKHLNLAPNDYIKLIITDTGTGIDETVKDKVYDPFFTTKGEAGNGLGLSQVFGFMERTGGAINLYSQIGLGTQFSLYFPRYYKNPAKKQENIKKIVEANLSGHETILVVDDEPALREVARQILLDAGYKVLTASDGKDALDILPTQNIDLVFSDVIMPNMDGYQMAEKIMEFYPKVKIQLSSGFSGERQSILKDSELEDNMLYKPYESNELLSRIRLLLDGDIVPKSER
jgi:CheY-like chemotaxis protein